MGMVLVQTPVHVALEFDTAPMMRRISAWSIDCAILVTYAQSMSFIMEGAGIYSFAWILLLQILPLLFYHLFTEIRFNGQSPGKMLMKMRVMSLEHGEPGWGQYLLRWVFRFWEWPMIFGASMLASNWLGMIIICAFMGIGAVISIGVTQKHQRLGDLAAGTTVVDLRKLYQLNDTIFREVDKDTYQVKFPGVMQLSDRDINAVHGVIKHARRSGQHDVAERVAVRIADRLKIQYNGYAIEFLQQLINDYNYLATQQA